VTDGSTLYTDVDLIDEQEFVAQHPEYIGLEGHELMVKRLEDEAQQRIELEAKRKELLNRRTQMQADSKTRKNDLDQLTETLKKFIEVLSFALSALTSSECYAYIRGASEVLVRIWGDEARCFKVYYMHLIRNSYTLGSVFFILARHNSPKADPCENYNFYCFALSTFSIPTSHSCPCKRRASQSHWWLGCMKAISLRGCLIVFALLP
jgi:Fms-interacting protein/Thoc5